MGKIVRCYINVEHPGFSRHKCIEKIFRRFNIPKELADEAKNFDIYYYPKPFETYIKKLERALGIKIVLVEK